MNLKVPLPEIVTHAIFGWPFPSWNRYHCFASRPQFCKVFHLDICLAGSASPWCCILILPSKLSDAIRRGKLVRERGAGSRDLENREREFLILIFLISYYRSQGDLLPWVIKLWTYKIVGGNIYYHGRINEYPSMVVRERIFYHGWNMNCMKYLNSEMEGIIYYHW
jgi:hypothetical protein